MTAVDPQLIAAINAIRPGCEILTGDTEERCDEPAAWILTWTANHGRPFRCVTLACLGCYVQITAHMRRHQACRDAFTVAAVEL